MPRPALAFTALLLLSACGPEPAPNSEPEYDEVSPIIEQDAIAYQVLDGERSGVWIVRPTAQ